jgi:DNA-binding MarR family transcriptional regulator
MIMNRYELMKDLEKTLRTTIRQLQKGMNEILGEDINRSEFFLLKYLQENEKAKVSTISKELNVTASHITTVADSLVKKGLIERERSTTDRRIVEMGLSDRGIELIQQLNEYKTNYLFSTMDELTNDDLQKLISLFNKFTFK